jgi:hypothetical protein
MYDLATMRRTEPSALPAPKLKAAAKKGARAAKKQREQQQRELESAPWAKRLAAHAESRPIDEAATRYAAERKLALLGALLDGGAKEPVQRMLIRLGVLQWQLVGGEGDGKAAFATVEVFGGRVENTRAADGSTEFNVAVREARVLHDRKEVVAAWLHDRDAAAHSPGGKGEVARALARGTMAQLRLCAAPPVDVAGTPVTIVDLLHVSLFPSNPRLGLFVQPSRSLLECFARYLGDEAALAASESAKQLGDAAKHAREGGGRGRGGAAGEEERGDRRLSVSAALGALKAKASRALGMRREHKAYVDKRAAQCEGGAPPEAESTPASVAAADRLLLVRLARVDAVHVKVFLANGAALPPLEWREKLWRGGYKGLAFEAAKTLLASAPAAAWHTVRATAKEKHRERVVEQKRKKREEADSLLAADGEPGAPTLEERKEARERARADEEIDDFLGG